MNIRLIMGGIIACGYNSLVGHLPVRTVRTVYLKGWLGGMGAGTGIQMGCRFLNGRKVHLGDRNVINFG